MSSLFSGLDTEPWKKSCDECESIESKYACPVYNCSQHGNEAIKWTHGDDCGGGFRLYSNGKVKCEKCGKEIIFCLQNYCCFDKSKNQKQYSYQKIKNIISKLAGMDTREVSPTFLISLSMCIDKQYKDYPDRFAD